MVKILMRVILLTAAFAISAVPAAAQQMEKSSWLPSLITETPDEGFALALTLSRRGVALTQPDRDVLGTLREAYARDPNSLIAASQVVAINFQTVAAANNYWRD
jgi:hypothetical protein